MREKRRFASLQRQRDGDGRVSGVQGVVLADELVCGGCDARVDAVGSNGEGHVDVQLATNEKPRRWEQGRGKEEKEWQFSA